MGIFQPIDCWIKNYNHAHLPNEVSTTTAGYY